LDYVSPLFACLFQLNRRLFKGKTVTKMAGGFFFDGRTLPSIHSTLDLLHVAEVPVPVPVPVPAPAPVPVAPVAPRPIERVPVPVIRHVAPPVVAAPVS